MLGIPWILRRHKVYRTGTETKDKENPDPLFIKIHFPLLKKLAILSINQSIVQEMTLVNLSHTHDF
jgi:hypothetical protein